MGSEAVHDFNGKTVLITGAASGIGLGISRAFAQRGASVVATDINAEGLERQRGDYGQDALVQEMDAGSEDSILRVAALLKARGMNVDVLVNNAGLARLEALDALTEAAMDLQWKVLLRGPMLCVKYLSPLMVSQANASVINIASIAATIQARRHAVYCACKAGITKFTQDAVKEMPALRFNTIQPGFIDTPILEAYATGSELEAVKNDFASRTPVGRMGRVEDIADACLFLASDSATFINGATLKVDGGVTVANSLEFL
ncbi:MAG: SDR family oxidoreductase [Pseudomonadota bacterium]